MSDRNRSAVWWRFLAVWLVLAGTALLLHARSSFELIPNRQTLDAFPRDLQGWSGKELPLTPNVLRILGPGDFLSRTYQNPANAETMDLFIAYYPSQRSGDTIHSPQKDRKSTRLNSSHEIPYRMPSSA